mgnify:CR=1 FL=1
MQFLKMLILIIIKRFTNTFLKIFMIGQGRSEQLIFQKKELFSVSMITLKKSDNKI